LLWCEPPIPKRDLITDKVPGAKELTAKVIRELGGFTGEGWGQEDDLTLVALQRLAPV
jgi:hypothetical protein